MINSIRYSIQFNPFNRTYEVRELLSENKGMVVGVFNDKQDAEVAVCISLSIIKRLSGHPEKVV